MGHVPHTWLHAGVTRDNSVCLLAALTPPCMSSCKSRAQHGQHLESATAATEITATTQPLLGRTMKHRLHTLQILHRHHITSTVALHSNTPLLPAMPLPSQQQQHHHHHTTTAVCWAPSLPASLLAHANCKPLPPSHYARQCEQKANSSCWTAPACIYMLHTLCVVVGCRA